MDRCTILKTEKILFIFSLDQHRKLNIQQILRIYLHFLMKYKHFYYSFTLFLRAIFVENLFFGLNYQ